MCQSELLQHCEKAGRKMTCRRLDLNPWPTNLIVRDKHHAVPNPPSVKVDVKGIKGYKGNVVHKIKGTFSFFPPMSKAMWVFSFFLRHGLLRVFPRDVLFDQLSPQSCFSCSKSVSEARDLVTSYLPSNGIALLTHHRESASGTLMQNAHRWRWEGEMGRKDTYTPFSPDSEAVLGQHAILTGFCH